MKGNIFQNMVGKCIHSITPFTLLDFPDKIACIFWFAGCNMRCQYCYNPEIVLGKGKIPIRQALDFLDTRTNLVEGVVFSGGECTLHPGIFDLAQQVKEKGFLIKVDTNGSKPDVLASLANAKLIHYVAIDFKAPAHSFYNITKSHFYDQFKASCQILNDSHIPFEIRTTVHSSLISNEDLNRMIWDLESMGYTGDFYIQHFKNMGKTLSPLQTSNNKSYVDIKPSKSIAVHYRNFT